ncbi:helix-turn-helix domain-containing protein [Microvirga lotononidis]|uniref:helix-turn-helix domain-containing protein n=2 Tax=Microvirga lotononidis TaxID=864069 RepID=UPI0009FE3C9C
MADDRGRKAVASIRRMTRVLHPSSMPLSGHLPVNLTLPAKLLKVTPKAVDLMLVQLGGALPRELTGRRRYRAWDIV